MSYYRKKRSPNPKVLASKFLSKILRHNSDNEYDIHYEEGGWVSIDEIVSNTDKGLTKELIEELVRTDNKERYSISDDHQKVKANYGHTREVELDIAPSVPPDVLYHGTATRFLSSILEEGIMPMKRQQVCLSPDVKVATTVAIRHGKPVILEINTKQMYEDGISLYHAAKNTWTVDYVPTKYIKQLESN